MLLIKPGKTGHVSENAQNMSQEIFLITKGNLTIVW